MSRAELGRLELEIQRQHRRIRGLEEREKLRDQAILELATALRSAGITAAGVGSLPSPSEDSVPAEQSADEPSTLSEE